MWWEFISRKIYHIFEYLLCFIFRVLPIRELKIKMDTNESIWSKLVSPGFEGLSAECIVLIYEQLNLKDCVSLASTNRRLLKLFATYQQEAYVLSAIEQLLDQEKYAPIKWSMRDEISESITQVLFLIPRPRLDDLLPDCPATCAFIYGSKYTFMEPLKWRLVFEMWASKWNRSSTNVYRLISKCYCTHLARFSFNPVQYQIFCKIMYVGEFPKRSRKEYRDLISNMRDLERVPIPSKFLSLTSSTLQEAVEAWAKLGDIQDVAYMLKYYIFSSYPQLYSSFFTLNNAEKLLLFEKNVFNTWPEKVFNFMTKNTILVTGGDDTLARNEIKHLLGSEPRTGLFEQNVQECIII